MDDPNGKWTGSRRAGGNFTLTCVKGFKVPGTHGRDILTLTCPESLQWTEDVRCVNIDDCASLKHGCGNFGLCTDQVGGYDCNCEQGYPHRRDIDGELACGNLDEDACGGHTCGAYGVCIDLNGNFPEFETEEDKELAWNASRKGNATTVQEHMYRCECTDGYYDDGLSCAPLDCGGLTDELGMWSGSTVVGGEYTLDCQAGSYIWTTSRTPYRRMTIFCGKTGKWPAHPVCRSDAMQARIKGMGALRFWACLGCVALCVCSAALAAGLTLGLATLEPFGLNVILAANLKHCATQQEKMKLHRERLDAKRVLPLVREHHRLLVTLLLFNTVANESLPIFLDELVPSWAAVLLSVSVVLICGEILPSAVFTGPSQMRIAATCVPLVKLLQVVFHPVAKPIARLLDRLIDQDDAEDGMKYTRAELLALLQLHGPPPARVQEEAAHTDISSQVCDVSKLIPDEETSGDDDLDKERSNPAALCLRSSELRLIETMLCLREAHLMRVPFTRTEDCMLASPRDKATEVIARNALRPGVCGILVAPISLDRQSRHPSCPASSMQVPAGSLVGCLRPRELLHGGNRLLGSLCSEPLVLIPDESSVLRALQQLDTSSRPGVVVSQGRVCGVVTRTDILRYAFRRSWHNDRPPSRMPSEATADRRSPTASTSMLLDNDSGQDDLSPRWITAHARSQRLRGFRAGIVPRSRSIEQALYKSVMSEYPSMNSSPTGRSGRATECRKLPTPRSSSSLRPGSSRSWIGGLGGDSAFHEARRGPAQT